MYDCLIVDDELELVKATAEYFNMFEVNTIWVTNGEDCLSVLNREQVRIILLDINLNQESGFELCKRIREKTNVPILFISARQSDDDILIALNIGGDDYVKKPYSLSVLLAKVKVVLKRTADRVSNSSRQVGEFVIDYEAMRVLRNGVDTVLKTKEFEVFTYLYENSGKVVTKDELFNNVWGDQFFSDGTLNVHIRKIREKIEDDPDNPRYIKTVWGVGYIFQMNE